MQWGAEIYPQSPLHLPLVPSHGPETVSSIINSKTFAFPEVVDTKKEVTRNVKRETKKTEVVKKSKTRHAKSRSTVVVEDEKLVF